MIRLSRLSPVQRFALYGFIVVSVLGLFLNWGLSHYVGEVLIQNSVYSTALAIQPMMTHELHRQDLRGPMGEARRQEFERLVADHIRSERIARVKIWNREGMVVYSDDPSLIGRRFPVQGGLRRALNGEIAFDPSDLEKEENLEEKRFGKLLEVYVPLQVTDAQEITGAYELYVYWQPISSQVWNVRYLVWGSLASGLALLYLALFGVFRDTFRTNLRQRDRMKALYEVGKAITSTLDLQTVMDEAVRISTEVLGCEAGALLLPDASGEYLHVEAGLGWDEEVPADVTIHAGQDTAGGHAFVRREPVLVPDMARETRFHVPESLLAQGLRSGLSVPMLLGDEVLGAMLLNSRHPGHFGEAEARLLSLIANQVAVVIENARLHEETRRRLTELSALFEVSSALREAHSVEEMLPIIVDKSVEVMDAESGHLALLTNGGEELAIQAVRGISLAITGKHLKVAGLPARCPARTGQLATCPAGCPLYSREHTFICAPVTTPEGVLGTLCVGRTGDWPLPGEATRLLAAIADLAGNAVHRAGLHEELEEAYVQTVLALANAIDARDSYTGGHGERLAAWAMAVARELGCSEEEIELVHWGALLHDVGKIGVPDHILLKPGPLNDEERAIIQRHPEIGAEIVEPVKRLQAVTPIICHHQERWDGMGYPARLKGEQIPLEARTLAVVDAYGAMTDERVYRKARSHAEAVEELQRNAGTQFDPQVVKAFLRVLGGGAVEQREGSDVVPADRLSDHARH